MISYGYGGRAGNDSNENLSVLGGLLPKDWSFEAWLYWKSAKLPEQHCANPKCGRLFEPRAEGDNYCNELCDLDANPQYRGKS
jgi:hypothetical protein